MTIMKCGCLVLIIILLSILPLHAYAKNDLYIPQWIKNTAKWWHDGKATDKKILVAISWLIQAKKIDYHQTDAEDKIPSWVKNIAFFWASNKISNNEFRNAIQYLLQSNTIKITDDTISIIDARGLNNVKYKGNSSLFDTYAYARDIVNIKGVQTALEAHFDLRPELDDVYGKIAIWDKPHSAAVIVPLFTSTAYWESSFYTYYRGECDSRCLTKEIQFDKPLRYSASGNAVAVLSILGYDTITDLDVDENPDILKHYDKIILLHNEYVTKKEYDAILHHPKVVYLYANPLYAEVRVNYDNSTITLLRGHGYPEKNITNSFGWKFDNRKAEYDTNCANKSFYKVDNGIMQDCYPENIIYNNMTLLKIIKDY